MKTLTFFVLLQYEELISGDIASEGDIKALEEGEFLRGILYIVSSESCSFTLWGCTGFDGVSRIAGCIPSLRDELVNHHPAIKFS